MTGDPQPAYHLEWDDPITIPAESEVEKPIPLLHFSTAQYDKRDGFLPRHYQDVPINGNESSISVKLIHTSYKALTEAEIAILKSTQLPAEIKVEAGIHLVKKQKKGSAHFIPLRKNAETGILEKLISYDLQVSPGVSNLLKDESRSLLPKANSVLQTGKWYKIAVSNDGVYKISYAFLKKLGIEVDKINPKNIRLYGNGGGMLPKLNSAPRPDDLLENAILVVGDSDTVFNKEDYILFYGQGPNRWKYNPKSVPAFQHVTNLFSDSTYYFITADMGVGKRIQTQLSSSTPATHFVTSFDDYAYHENDTKNLIISGNKWFGEYFENIDSYDFPFDFPFIEPLAATVKVAMAARNNKLESQYAVSCQSGSASFSISGVNFKGDTYCELGEKSFQFVPSSPALTVNVTKKTASAIAWLDYIEVNVRRKLEMFGNQLFFRDVNSTGPGHVAQYTLQTTIPIQVWDVTDPVNVRLQLMNNNQFALAADSLKEFLAFTGQSFLTPQLKGRVENQNLHSIADKEMVIVTHPDFIEEAKQLAAIHEREDNISTTVVTPQQIYNEFSSGAQDITAIRDFIRMIYNRSSGALPNYLLLIGDGSYNNKAGSVNNSNFIPTYESDLSNDFTASFVSDDYYGLLDDSEGIFDPYSNEAVDIGIGRFPVRTRSEVQALIGKINSYRKSGLTPNVSDKGCSNGQSSPFGDWRNLVCFVADDDDMDAHIHNAEDLSKIMTDSFKNYNQDKIYLDAYKQESSPGGERYPDVNDAIDKRIEKGCLLFNYTGHGGEVGLAHERIVDIPMINKWSNINNMPLFFTATCEFSRYDDPNRTSAGEYTFLNPKGGAIALFTTVRLVNSAENALLNESFLEHAFTPIQGQMPRLGDIFQRMKSESINLNRNSRGFSFLGDPALRLAYPAFDVTTDSINNKPVTLNSSDTLNGLSLITITGHVESNSVPITNYNGLVYPTVFNKMQSITTLSNNPPNPADNSGSPPYTFSVQKNILYKGKASVTNGRFKYEFIVPKDISAQYGVGRISYYTENGSDDGKGYYDKIIIGGMNDSAPKDNTGPQINLYMNDTKFISGGTTNESPSLYAVVTDATGINTTGNGIGHDITAILDANTNHAVVLNDYYQADLNSYKSGTIRYPFKNLPEGKHTLSLKVWDVYNNSSMATTEFEVSTSSGLALNHVLNYPNPFTTKTQFFFEHNQCCQLLNVQLQIFTVSGKLVKNYSKYIHAEGYRSDPIEWDGRDDFGDRVARGVYIYRLKVKNSRGESAEQVEKLVVLN